MLKLINDGADPERLKRESALDNASTTTVGAR